MPIRYAKHRKPKRRKTKRDRQIREIERANAGKPGFIGVTTGLTFTAADGRVTKHLGMGAVFMGERFINKLKD